MSRPNTYELLQTIEVICASPHIHQYRIGITANPSVRRRDYAKAIKLKYTHFVIIASDLTKGEACELEEALQIGTCERRTSRTYRKDDPTVRDDVYRCSAGGSDRYGGREYCVYMTWK